MVVGGCGLSDELQDASAYGDLGGVTTVGGDLALEPGMSFAFQPNCAFGRRRVNIGGTVVVGETGPRELNALANRLHHV
jgi:Xaa-Pro aminopeptidase